MSTLLGIMEQQKATKPNKYQDGKIYKITDVGRTECYIGSTTSTLSARMAQHRAQYKGWKEGKWQRVSSFDLFDKHGAENCSIELIEAHPCKNKDELRRREGHYIKKTVCVNKVVAGRSQKQWVEENKDRIARTVKAYHEANKDKIRAHNTASYVCACGSEIQWQEKARHERTKKHVQLLANLKQEV